MFYPKPKHEASVLESVSILRLQVGKVNSLEVVFSVA
jgi:hypothetical protein